MAQAPVGWSTLTVMCGRYTLNHQQWIEDVFGSDLSRLPDVIRRPRFNVAPGQLVLTLARGTGAPVAEQMLWGIPSPRPDGPPRMINARAENLARSPFWRTMLERSRCAIPADGFYEWKPSLGSGAKQPHWFAREHSHGFFFAGLCRDDAEQPSCVIITTDPNELVQDVHDRMPVMLTAEDARIWLDGTVEEALALLRPFPSVEMTVRPVSRSVNDVARDDADVIAPVPVDTAPESLF
jgi:putative SOS response-associated peptidase YedK